MRVHRPAGTLAGGLLLTIGLLLSGCTSQTDVSPTHTYDSSSSTISIVAGSEQKQVFDDIVGPWCKTQGLTCIITYKGSVDQARLLQGTSGDAPYDAFWFASSIWRQLGDTSSKLQDVQSTSITPVVFAGWKSEMTKLGLTQGTVTIDRIKNVVESNKTSTWVTNPTQSNSGAMTYFAFLNSFAGNKPGTPLTQSQLDSSTVQTGIKTFVQAFDNTPPSTGTLMDSCIAAPNRCRTMFTYEDLVMQYNKELVAKGHEPLYAVYPTGSLAIADAPIGFYPHGTDSKKHANFQKLEQFLLSSTTQQKLLQYGRRPVTSIGLSLDNAPTNVFNPSWGIQTTIKEQAITFPAASVIESALSRYQTALRLPADTVYCIDGSGSMGGNGGWDGVQKAAGVLFDPTQSARYLVQLNPADTTTVMIFASDIKNGPWTVHGNASNDLLDLKAKINKAKPDGGTGIYRCLERAANLLGASSSGRRQLIILMTDGQDNVGGKATALQTVNGKHIPVIAIGFGTGADTSTLQHIADATSGAYLPGGNSVDDVAQALRSATAYK